jgi:hypothetical protein
MLSFKQYEFYFKWRLVGVYETGSCSKIFNLLSDVDVIFGVMVSSSDEPESTIVSNCRGLDFSVPYLLFCVDGLGAGLGLFLVLFVIRTNFVFF